MKKVVTVAALLALTVLAPMNAGAVHTGWFADESASGIKNPVGSDAAAKKEGKNIYDQNCAKCHGEDGKGKGVSTASMQAELPDFTDKEIAGAETEGDWFWKVRVGLFEMPPFQLVLSDEEIWKAVSYIRTMSQ
ncbi:MAG: c-type cytochrome [Nitrospinota bacterium]